MIIIQYQNTKYKEFKGGIRTTQYISDKKGNASFSPVPGNVDYQKERIVRHLKRYNLGKHRSITFKELSESLNIGARELRSLIAEIVTDGDAPIGSSSDSGYYYTQSPEEGKQVAEELRSRIKKLSRRRKGYLKALAEEFKGQQSLFSEEAI